MFHRKQRLGKRKSKVSIDLNSLTKKDRKIYRQQKNKKVETNRKDENEEQEEPKEVDEQLQSSSDVDDDVDNDAVDDDDDGDNEGDAYRQLVSTLGVAGTKSHKESDEEESEEEDDDDDDDEADDEVEAEAGMEGGGLAGSGVDEEQVVSESEDEQEDEGSEENASEQEEDTDNDDDDDDEVLDVEDDDIFADSDPFIQHFEKDLEEKVAEELADCKACKREEVKIPGVGSAVYQWPHDSLKRRNTHRKEKDLTKLHVKESLLANLSSLNRKLCKKAKLEQDGLAVFQHGLFSILNNYQDLLYLGRTTENQEQIRLVYCLHALNHILKTRRRVISHNTKLKNKPETAGDDEYRDQGLTRPKVLIVCPFRESAKRVVHTLIQLLNPTDQGFVANKKRFYEEYGLPPEEEPFKGHKPEDFEATFDGNIDDHFRIGVGVAKKTLKLYTKFYSADIIVASPLGLRTLIGTEDEKERDYDFLNSIEVLILDQTDVFMMQNWDHVMHLMKHLHLQPQESHGADFSRVRMWTINGWSRYYRQTLMFSSVPLPEINALFNKHCHNYAGKVQVQREQTAGTICQIATQLPQVFHRIECSNHLKMADERFDFFVKKILPHHSETLMSNTLVFMPSYFDFVRLRNYMLRERITAVFVSEYTKDGKVSKARSKFFHKKISFMLYAERYHFFRRVTIRGIRHLVFYGLPAYPHLYSEMCNMLQDKKTGLQADNQTCTVLYTKYEAVKLAEMVGTERASQMLNSKKSVHMFVTGENG